MNVSCLTVVAHDIKLELREKIRHAHAEAFKTRLKAILLATQGKKRFEIVDRLTVDAKSVTVWLKRYNKEGTGALVSHKGGRSEGNPKWDAALFVDLAAEIEKGGYWSIPRMQTWLIKHRNVAIPEQTIWYRIDQLGYSHKLARPAPVLGSKESQEGFKKAASSRSSSR
jgi:transposase